MHHAAEKKTSQTLSRAGPHHRRRPGHGAEAVVRGGVDRHSLQPDGQSFYERIVRDDPDRKKIAIVAVAHYLVRVALAMLRSGECWRESNRSGKQETPQSTPTDGGGETPSRPQGFSPPPGTITDAPASSPPPPHSASPFSPEGRISVLELPGVIEKRCGLEKRKITHTIRRPC